MRGRQLGSEVRASLYDLDNRPFVTSHSWQVSEGETILAGGLPV